MLAIIGCVMTATLVLSVYLRRRLGGVRAPTVQECVATLWCGPNSSSRPNASRQTLLLCFRTAVVAWMVYRVTFFFEEPTIDGQHVTVGFKLSYFTGALPPCFAQVAP